MMMLSALVLTCLVLATHANQVSFRVSPRLAVETVTDEVKLECKVPPAVTDVQYGVMVMIRQTPGNGTQELLTAIKTASMLSKSPDNRTEAEGAVPSIESEDKSISLTVTLLEPVEPDGGNYECQVLYVDNNNQLQNFIATAKLNVSAVPPPNYVPEMSDSCECDAIWDEIDDIKASLSTGGGSGPAAPAASECQVSFSAHFSTRHGYLIYSGETAMFDSATSNKGDAYDAETGEFTAPCDGQYFFTVSLRSQQELDPGYVDGVIMAGDVAVARTSVFTASAISNLEQASTSSVVTLTQGQKVKVVIQSTSAGEFIGEEYSTFSGFYISP